MPALPHGRAVPVAAGQGHACDACCTARCVSRGVAGSSAKPHARASIRHGSHADARHASPFNRNRAAPP
ncbi:hypothetical protein A8D95_40375 [Burkholderia cenocepacia]|uniref:Uncharacterized protein n=1 Tax=Burkholderia cenocepacia TaxID=95486 RepID=A0A1V2WBE9_9BURK|nr:hypothetical protein A8D83_23625 [Burkholderia cenocepacia]ONJ20952.1 hypothetical protein A8D90_18495 [Burkholderia cenocepacia]ONP17728.1 hypothetical protein A8D84_35480 [Burkholderia cenocepacia]ONP36555.1 hypothetical protein A8D86_24265 [Burkholderia cenocepacia]ONP38138.1 hypothetical protein A8D85_17280 [Burkholderia cenocepacia]